MTGRYLEAYSRGAAIGAFLEWLSYKLFPWHEAHVGSFSTVLYFPCGAIIEVMDRPAIDPRPGYSILITSPSREGE